MKQAVRLLNIYAKESISPQIRELAAKEKTELAEHLRITYSTLMNKAAGRGNYSAEQVKAIEEWLSDRRRLDEIAREQDAGANEQGTGEGSPAVEEVCPDENPVSDRQHQERQA